MRSAVSCRCLDHLARDIAERDGALQIAGGAETTSATFG
jgi:hypothetical protein